MPLQDLKDTPRVKKRGIACDRGQLRILVLPGSSVVFALVFGPAAEQPVEVLGISEIIINDCGGVCVIDDIVTKVTLVLDDVANNSPKECDIGACAYRRVDVGDSARPREAWIDMNDRGAARLRFHHPTEADGVALGHVGALNNDAIRVLKILLKR